MLTVQRDPFARGEYVRRTYTRNNVGWSLRTKFECRWCGQSKDRLYTYEWRSDGGRAHGESDLFCDFNCFKDFNR